MASETDPARELADLCGRLSSVNGQLRGAAALAHLFDVPAWSTEFYQIIFTISGRADELIIIVEGLNLDADYKADAVRHIQQVKEAFSQTGLTNQWSHALAHYLSAEHVQPIKMISGMVRGVCS